MTLFDNILKEMETPAARDRVRLMQLYTRVATPELAQNDPNTFNAYNAILTGGRIGRATTANEVTTATADAAAEPQNADQNAPDAKYDKSIEHAPEAPQMAAEAPFNRTAQRVRLDIDKLQELIKASGKTLTEISIEIGQGRNYMSNFLADVKYRKFRISTIEKLARYFDVPTESLITEDASEPTDTTAKRTRYVLNVDRLEKLIQRHGKSVGAISEDMGKSYYYLSNIISTAKRGATLYKNTAKTIADYFGVTLDYIAKPIALDKTEAGKFVRMNVNELNRLITLDGRSKTTISAAAGHSGSYLSAYESEARRGNLIPYTVAANIARVIGCSVDDFADCVETK